MLDVSIRLGVLNLLADLQREEGLGVLYIPHDLATARHFSDEIMVLNQGRVDVVVNDSIAVYAYLAETGDKTVKIDAGTMVLQVGKRKFARVTLTA